MVTCMCMAEILGPVCLCSYARSRWEKPDTPAKQLATASIAYAASAFAFLPATAIGKASEGLRFGNRERFSSPCPSLPTPPSRPCALTTLASLPPVAWLFPPRLPPSSPSARSGAGSPPRCRLPRPLRPDRQPAVPPRSPPLNGRQRRAPLRTGHRLPLARSAGGERKGRSAAEGNAPAARGPAARQGRAE